MDPTAKCRAHLVALRTLLAAGTPRRYTAQPAAFSCRQVAIPLNAESVKHKWNVKGHDYEKTWMKEHGAMLAELPAGLGKTKRVTSQGISDTKNDNMLYCIVQAESHEAAANLFANHPHLGIPQASIEIMELNPLSGMK
jgi:hypothetical protein